MLKPEYGQWKILQRLEYPFALAECLGCNNQYKVYLGNLTSGKSTRCRKCSNKITSFKHGKAGTPLWRLWHKLKKRGQLSKEWHESFETFIQTITEHKNRETLLPVKPELPIGPGNWKWGKQQQGTIFEYQGEKLNVQGWCDKLGISRQRFWQRVESGYVGQELFAPNQKTI